MKNIKRWEDYFNLICFDNENKELKVIMKFIIKWLYIVVVIILLIVSCYK